MYSKWIDKLLLSPALFRHMLRPKLNASPGWVFVLNVGACEEVCCFSL